MSTDQEEGLFWRIIEEGITIEGIQLILDVLKIEHNLVFFKVFCEKLKTLILSKIAEVFLVTLNRKPEDTAYISNDGFLDFRAWIVQQGRETYQLFLDFKSEKELLHLNLDPNIAWSEDLLYVVNISLHKKDSTSYGELDFIITGLHDLKEHSLLYETVEFKKLEQKYPLLYSKYA